MEKINYQRLMEAEIAEISENNVPTLLLHSCCGPCSSAVLEVLSRHFAVTVYYYNPNIYPKGEFALRESEQKRLLREMPFSNPVSFLSETYDENEFLNVAKGLEAEPEGGNRCTACFQLRLHKTAEKAKACGFDYFTTTLSISPHKDAVRLNAIGEETAKQVGVKYLHADFKKKEGYKRSTVLASEYNLYRQNYCGCRYSLRPQREEGKA